MWLFCVGGFFLVRLLLDSVMVRRPLLEPNLSTDGLTFTAVALLIFLMVNVFKQPPDKTDLAGAERWEQVVSRQEKPTEEASFSQQGPGFPLFYMLASLPNRALIGPIDEAHPENYRTYLVRAAAAKTTAILAHLAAVIGIVLIGYRHFDSFQTQAWPPSALYLLMPYTSQMTGHVEHAVPAALLVWSVEAYRRPMVAGIIMGLAAGAVYYPLFLLPLWCSFYWQRGLVRFVMGVVITLLVLVFVLLVRSSSAGAFVDQLQQMFNVTTIFMKSPDGFWHFHDPAYRFPVVAAFLALCGSFAIWPAQKNLGTLLSCSAVVMLGIQFWRPHQGGLYMAWYLPLLILTIFRPNLEDRVAITALTEYRWWRWRRIRPPAVERPASAA